MAFYYVTGYYFDTFTNPELKEILEANAEPASGLNHTTMIHRLRVLELANHGLQIPDRFRVRLFLRTIIRNQETKEEVTVHNLKEQLPLITAVADQLHPWEIVGRLNDMDEEEWRIPESSHKQNTIYLLDSDDEDDGELRGRKRPREHQCFSSPISVKVEN